MSGQIVVLDAEPMVRRVITAILEREGYAVTPIETLQVAVDTVRKSPPDLLLTNVYLPGITGHDAIRLLKGICPDMKVLMVSGLPDTNVIREWTGQHGFDTFPKPFTAQDLLDKVRDMLDVEP